jgi:hypothetical protein
VVSVTSSNGDREEPRPADHPATDRPLGTNDAVRADVLGQPGLSLLPNDHPPPDDRPHRIGRALRWLAGVNEELLAWVPTERAKYTALGGVVLGTATIAAFSMSMALTEVLGGFHPLTLVPVLIWGVFIANLDRWLVSSSAGGWWGRRLAVLLPRLALAFAFGVVIAEPLVLRVFETAIEEHVHQERAREVAVLESALTRCNPEPNADETVKEAARGPGCATYQLGLDTRFAAVRADLDAKRRTEKTLDSTVRAWSEEQARRDTLASNECAGTKVPGTTGQVGRGPECERREREAADYQASHPVAEQEAKLSDVRADILDLEATLRGAQQNYETDRTSAIRDRVAELRDSQGAIGLLERFAALDELTSSNAFLATAKWFIRLFFIAIDCLPVLVKFISGQTRYDELVEQHSQSAWRVYGQSVRTTEEALLVDLRERRHRTDNQADMARSETDHERRVHQAKLDVELDHQVTLLAEQLRLGGQPRHNGSPAMRDAMT